MNIETVTKRFGAAYERNKKAKTWLEQQQKRLFQAFDEQIELHPPQRRRSTVIPEGKDAKEYITKFHPGWRIVSQQEDIVILDENPSLLSHTFTNHETGMVYGRARVEASPSLDDDRLRQEDPQLWERITIWPEPWYSLVHDAVKNFTAVPWSPDSLDEVVGEHLTAHGVERVLRDLNTLSTNDLALIEQYIIPGPVSVRLIPPRKTKPEELEHE